MDATYISEGRTIVYTPQGAVAAGDVVVVGDMVGLARDAIGASVAGALQVAGEIRVPKATGSSAAIAQGKIVYWDANNEVATETSQGNTRMGKTAAAAADDDATVDVILGL